MKKKKTLSGLKKGDVITLSITDLSDTGSGIGFAYRDRGSTGEEAYPADRGLIFFVKGAVPGDVAEVLVTKITSNCGYARLNRIITPSPDREVPSCPAAASCGGCQLQNLSYSAELRWKHKRVRDALIRIGGFDDSLTGSVLAPIRAGDPSPAPRYRNKVQMPVGVDRDGKLKAGFFAARTHSIIAVDDCPLCHETAASVTGIVLDFMERRRISAYDERSGSGLVRHILVRRGYHSGQVCVCLIINSQKPLPHSDELADTLFGRIPGMTSLSYSPNTSRTNVILGDRLIPVRGEPFITDTMCGLKFFISPLAFYQVNTPQAERLYDQALEYAALTGNERVIDLYCGIGTLTLAAAKRAAHVTGVEIVPDAIECARKNACENGIDNVDFIAGSAEEILPALADKTPAADVLIVDPPRAGLAASCIDAILSLSPSKIIYVSCNPSTLARDLKLLSDNYSLTAARPFDMFPKTCHVETVALLSKLSEAKHHIEVKVDMDELDLTSAEAKATYKEIQDWVQEMYGFHVTNLNIAQVKQKHGVIEREKYNKPKSENSKQPGCPEEKVKAIEDAMRHFQMI
ncbi:MAG: 23S rRNA (uracil(1939)-C(5))-methyltransferase RlmD [Lachnospiraceae bacterium]|nr:23S rRNA (uracil(1939)-C(5))-methyltransferase RlmD [Lachnospiraceae bacterium]